MNDLCFLTQRYRVELTVIDELYVLRLSSQEMPRGGRAFYEARGLDLTDLLSQAVVKNS